MSKSVMRRIAAQVKNVHVLWDCTPYEDRWIVGIFTSESKLEEYVEKHEYRTPVKKELINHMWITEEELNPND